MGLLGGVFKSLVNPATLLQLATGPAGWASLAMRTIGTAIAQQVIQQLGQKLGLPSSVINMAQQAFSATSGTGDLGQQTIREAVSNFAKQVNLSPRQQGQVERAANNAVDQLMQTALADAKKFAGKGEKEAAAEGGKGGFLRAIAMALGQAADAKMNEMSELAGKISAQASANNNLVNGLNGKDPNGNQSAQLQNNSTQLGSLNSMFQAVSQELSILQNVISNSLKTIGEAQSTVARKG